MMNLKSTKRNEVLSEIGRLLDDYMNNLDPTVTPDESINHPTALERREMYKAKFQKPDFELSDRIAATKEYVNAMSEKQLEEFGHDTLNGKDQMIAALDTIAQLAEYDQNAAQKAYCDFMDINLSGFWIDIQDAPKP